MGDLDKTQSAGITKITGSDVLGNEQTPVKSYDFAELATADLLSRVGDNDSITVGTTATLASVNGTTNLLGRKVIKITNVGNTTLFWGFNSGTTSLAGATPGEPIYRRSSIVIAATEDLDVYVVSSAAGGTAVIHEAG